MEVFAPTLSVGNDLTCSRATYYNYRPNAGSRHRSLLLAQLPYVAGQVLTTRARRTYKVRLARVHMYV